MPIFQTLTCEIAVGGSDKTIVVRGALNPITFPEFIILATLHGKENVRNVRPHGEVDRDDAEERDRLARIYGHQVVAQCFQADHVPLPQTDPRAAAARAAAAAAAAAKAARDAKAAAKPVVAPAVFGDDPPAGA